MKIFRVFDPQNSTFRFVGRPSGSGLPLQLPELNESEKVVNQMKQMAGSNASMCPLVLSRQNRLNQNYLAPLIPNPEEFNGTEVSNNSPFTSAIAALDLPPGVTPTLDNILNSLSPSIDAWKRTPLEINQPTYIRVIAKVPYGLESSSDEHMVRWLLALDSDSGSQSISLPWNNPQVRNISDLYTVLLGMELNRLLNPDNGISSQFLTRDRLLDTFVGLTVASNGKIPILPELDNKNLTYNLSPGTIVSAEQFFLGNLGIPQQLDLLEELTGSGFMPLTPYNLAHPDGTPSPIMGVLGFTEQIYTQFSSFPLIRTISDLSQRVDFGGIDSGTIQSSISEDALQRQISETLQAELRGMYNSVPINERRVAQGTLLQSLSTDLNDSQSAIRISLQSLQLQDGGEIQSESVVNFAASLLQKAIVIQNASETGSNLLPYGLVQQAYSGMRDNEQLPLYLENVFLDTLQFNPAENTSFTVPESLDNYLPSPDIFVDEAATAEFAEQAQAEIPVQEEIPTTLTEEQAIVKESAQPSFEMRGSEVIHQPPPLTDFDKFLILRHKPQLIKIIEQANTTGEAESFLLNASSSIPQDIRSKFISVVLKGCKPRDNEDLIGQINQRLNTFGGEVGDFLIGAYDVNLPSFSLEGSFRDALVRHSQSNKPIEPDDLLNFRQRVLEMIKRDESFSSILISLFSHDSPIHNEISRVVKEYYPPTQEHETSNGQYTSAYHEDWALRTLLFKQNLAEALKLAIQTQSESPQLSLPQIWRIVMSSERFCLFTPTRGLSRVEEKRQRQLDSLIPREEVRDLTERVISFKRLVQMHLDQLPEDQRPDFLRHVDPEGIFFPPQIQDGVDQQQMSGSGIFPGSDSKDLSQARQGNHQPQYGEGDQTLRQPTNPNQKNRQYGEGDPTPTQPTAGSLDLLDLRLQQEAVQLMLYLKKIVGINPLDKRSLLGLLSSTNERTDPPSGLEGERQRNEEVQGFLESGEILPQRVGERLEISEVPPIADLTVNEGVGEIRENPHDLKPVEQPIQDGGEEKFRINDTNLLAVENILGSRGMKEPTDDEMSPIADLTVNEGVGQVEENPQNLKPVEQPIQAGDEEGFSVPNTDLLVIESVQKQREGSQVPIETGLQPTDFQVPVIQSSQLKLNTGGCSSTSNSDEFQLPKPVLTVEDLKAFTANHLMPSKGSIESPPDGQPGIIQSQVPPLEQALQEGDPASLPLQQRVKEDPNCKS